MSWRTASGCKSCCWPTPARIDRIVRAASRHTVLADLLARFATGALTHAQFKRSMLRRALPVYVREKARQFVLG